MSVYFAESVMFLSSGIVYPIEKIQSGVLMQLLAAERIYRYAGIDTGSVWCVGAVGHH